MTCGSTTQVQFPIPCVAGSAPNSSLPAPELGFADAVQEALSGPVPRLGAEDTHGISHQQSSVLCAGEWGRWSMGSVGYGVIGVSGVWG
jgi:hypothetical protein